jgi:hypothetical protein
MSFHFAVVGAIFEQQIQEGPMHNPASIEIGSLAWDLNPGYWSESVSIVVIAAVL